MTYALNDDHLKNTKPSFASIMFIWFLRVIAIISMASGASYWVALVGINEGALGRFDLMPVHWQIAATSLAVLLPVASVGLWMTVSWGPVIWVAAALIEVVMYVWFKSVFGSKPLIIMEHIAVALLYLAFRFVLYREQHLSRR